MNEMNEWFQMERDKEVRIQAEHVAAGHCTI